MPEIYKLYLKTKIEEPPKKKYCWCVTINSEIRKYTTTHTHKHGDYLTIDQTTEEDLYPTVFPSKEYDPHDLVYLFEKLNKRTRREYHNTKIIEEEPEGASTAGRSRPIKERRSIYKTMFRLK